MRRMDTNGNCENNSMFIKIPNSGSSGNMRILNSVRSPGSCFLLAANARYGRKAIVIETTSVINAMVTARGIRCNHGHVLPFSLLSRADGLRAADKTVKAARRTGKL
mmetsp:Transcript_7162/g.15500  ORF Transcript_7162/g.15500 Transcript_7162/m.15500 type:complete len:107 (-) Transcript_7162:370-690(-)